MAHLRNVFSVPPGAPFIETLVEALLEGRLLPDLDGDPLLMSDATIYVPTRRAARSLRAALVQRMARSAAILPDIRPLGDFDEDAAIFDAPGSSALELEPPIGALERILALAPLVNAWKLRLPAHVAAMFGAGENLVVPASMADAIWLARDIARLVDEVETEEANFARLASIVPDELAGWWQVTLEFLKIVTEYWPQALSERQRMNPAAHRNASIDAEAARLTSNRDAGPVIAAGSTGSIPATARLLAAVASHPRGAVVLPGLDTELDESSWAMIDGDVALSNYGHPQFGLKKLIATIGVSRHEVVPLGSRPPSVAARCRLVNESLRPAESTDRWVECATAINAMIEAGALEGVTLVEAANEQEEALAIAIALRKAVAEPGRRTALVTGDRNLAHRVSAELLRFGIRADDSGGRPLGSTPAAVLLRLVAEVAFRPGKPEQLLDLVAHPMLLVGRRPSQARRAAALAELVLLRGFVGRPDISELASQLPSRRAALGSGSHPPVWLERISETDWHDLAEFLASLADAFGPLIALRNGGQASLTSHVEALVRALECLGRDHEGRLDALYSGEDGERLVSLLRELLESAADLPCSPPEVPDMLAALILPELVKPSAAGNGRIAIWGVLEARLQSVDTLVIGGVNEASWPGKAETGPFLSRLLGSGIGLAPPERRIGQAAHDFLMAMGNREVILTRAVRVDGAPTTPTRWLQRLLTVAGSAASEDLLARGRQLVGLTAAMDVADRREPAVQPRPTPPLAARPARFSVTEIETLRRDPYAIYARRILRLEPLEPLTRDPGAADRGSLFHEILSRFALSGADPASPDAARVLERIGAECFAEFRLPADVQSLWWPRFLALVPELVAWERGQAARRVRSFPEVRASHTPIESTGVTLSGRADRIDLLTGQRSAEIIDFKTGNGPSKAQAHTLLSPQLPLEGALLARGAFREIGAVAPADLLYVRLKPDGSVERQSILTYRTRTVPAEELSERAWSQLVRLLSYYGDEANGYLSRAVPLREHDTDGDYDHLARVQEWSAGFGGSDE